MEANEFFPPITPHIVIGGAIAVISWIAVFLIETFQNQPLLEYEVVLLENSYNEKEVHLFAIQSPLIVTSSKKNAVIATPPALSTAVTEITDESVNYYFRAIYPSEKYELVATYLGDWDPHFRFIDADKNTNIQMIESSPKTFFIKHQLWVFLTAIIISFLLILYCIYVSWKNQRTPK